MLNVACIYFNIDCIHPAIHCLLQEGLVASGIVIIRAKGCPEGTSSQEAQL